MDNGPFTRKIADEAHEVALKLFLECCTPQQRKEYKLSKTIEVIGSKGGKYLIDCCGVICNIRDMKTLKKYCLHLDLNYECPAPDHWLAQKLLIESNEGYFRRRAARFDINLFQEIIRLFVVQKERWLYSRPPKPSWWPYSQMMPSDFRYLLPIEVSSASGGGTGSVTVTTIPKSTQVTNVIIL